MKKHSGSKWLCGILALLSALTVTVLAATYDSSEDPIISLSYLTDVFRPALVKDYEAKIAELEAKVDALSGGTVSTPVQMTHADSGYVVVEMKYGDCLFAEGPIDVLLRSGSAICIAPDASQGISDYTDGVEIYNGEYLTVNHMCLIPRADGRGVMATAQTVYIMVKGEYSLVES